MSSAEGSDPSASNSASSESASSSSDLSSNSSSGAAREQPVTELVFAAAAGRQIRLFGAGAEHVYEVCGAYLVVKQRLDVAFGKTSVFGAGFPALQLGAGAFGVYGRRVYGLAPFRECARLPFAVQAFEAAAFNDKIALLGGGVLRFLNIGAGQLAKSAFQPPARFLQAAKLVAFADALFFVPRFGGVIGALRGSTFEEHQLGTWFSAQLVNAVEGIIFLEIDQQETILVELAGMRVRRAGRLMKEVAWSYKVGEYLICRDNDSALFADVLACFK